MKTDEPSAKPLLTSAVRLLESDNPIGDWSLFRPAGFFQAFKQAFLNRRCWNLTHIALDQDLSIGASVRRSTANLGLKVNPEFYIDRSNSL